MINILTRNILRFAILVIAQALFFNNIQFSSLGVNPFIYILFIILLPFETPKSLLLIIAFLLGLSVDLFSDTFGMHAAATVFMAYMRPMILSSIAPRDGYETGAFPRVFYFGFNWFFKYSLFLVLSHHFFYYFLEAFTFSDFFSSLFKIFISTILSVFLVILSQYLVYKK